MVSVCCNANVGEGTRWECAGVGERGCERVCEREGEDIGEIEGGGKDVQVWERRGERGERERGRGGDHVGEVEVAVRVPGRASAPANVSEGKSEGEGER